MIEPCPFANGHCWHDDLRYRDPGPTKRPEGGFMYHPNTAERCCLCDVLHVITIGPRWSGPWNPEGAPEPDESWRERLFRQVTGRPLPEGNTDFMMSWDG